MDTDAVILQFNVLVNRIIRLFTSVEFRLVNELFLVNAVERFDAGIVVTVALATHTANHLVRLQPRPVFCRSVL